MSTYIINRPENNIDLSAFLERCRKGLKERYDPFMRYWAFERLCDELAVIVMFELTGSFFIASEFATEALKQGARMAPCSEQAGYALTAYILGLSPIDPIADNVMAPCPLPEDETGPAVMVQIESGQERGIVRCIEERFGEGIVELAG